MINDLIKCPYCGSQKFGKVPMQPNQHYILIVKDETPVPPTQGTKVTVYGCSDCGLISLQSKEIYWNS